MHYAEGESQQISLHSCQYDYVVVIPACDEACDFLETVFSHISDRCLIILVVNSPVGQNQWQNNNILLIDYLFKKSHVNNKINQNVSHLEFSHLPDVLLIDRNSAGMQLNPKQGVGLARKIGCDVALSLFAQDLIKQAWIFSTDADVILPKNYFRQINQLGNHYSAVVLDFIHLSDSLKLSKLQQLYDFKMRYYLAGIEFAKVAYSYIPLGSTLIASMESYAQVRGFPKRNAGEDFYLLNKLAKVKPIKYKVDNCIIQIQSRLSDRVPFGTGPALKKINELKDINDYSYYNPQCFIYLKFWKEYLDALWSESGLSFNKPQDELLLQLYYFLDCHLIFKKSSKQITSHLRWQQFIHQWFDAFKILKTVHFFDKKFERLNYKRLLKHESFVKVTSLKIT